MEVRVGATPIQETNNFNYSTSVVSRGKNLLKQTDRCEEENVAIAMAWNNSAAPKKVDFYSLYQLCVSVIPLYDIAFKPR